jgi:putative hemolysin
VTLLESIGWILLALLGLAGSWLCSGMETGTYTLNRIRLMVRSERPITAASDQTARILRHEIDNPERLLGTILIGNNLFAYLAAAAITAMLASLGYGDTKILIINIIILTPVILIFCEALPKELFRVNADRLAYFFAPLITVLRLLFTIAIVLPLVTWFARWAARIIGVEGEIGLAVSARERVATLLKDTVSQGSLSPAQGRLVDRAIAFHRLTLGDEMVPWPRVVAVRAEWDRRRVLRLMVRRSYSRYPVVEACSPDASQGESRPVLRVVGVLRQADLYMQPRATVRELMIEPVRLPPQTTLREALLRLRDNQSAIIVVEQNGRPLGIVTVKDLAEPLTGVLEE